MTGKRKTGRLCIHELLIVKKLTHLRKHSIIISISYGFRLNLSCFSGEITDKKKRWGKNGHGHRVWEQ